MERGMQSEREEYKNLPLTETVKNPLHIEEWRAFDDLATAFSYANITTNELLLNNEPVIANAIWQDRFKSARPKPRICQVLGVSVKTGKECAKLAPGGKWWVNCNKLNNGSHQWMAWYSKYLPYAYAMMLSEDGFEAFGIDYDSINSYFRTVGGFVSLGQGDIVASVFIDPLKRLKTGQEAIDNTKKVNVIEDDDLTLYNKVYNASMRVKSPGLIYNEAYNPAFCFVAYRRPDLFVKYIQHKGRSKAESLADWRTQHFMQVAEECGVIPPEFKWKR